MMRNLILLIIIVAIAALTTSCGVKRNLTLPPGEDHQPMFGDAAPPPQPPNSDPKTP